MSGRRLVGLLVALAACGSTDHPYVARRFDVARGCVDRSSGVDVVRGAQPGNCATVCLVGSSPLSDGGSELFVSMMCAPYPPGFDVTGKDPRCRDAVAAFDRGDICLADGGTSSPVEAGADARPGDAAPE